VLQVKKALAQTIIAMAHHGYLELEGGQILLEFVVMQCSGPASNAKSQRQSTATDPEYVSPEALRAMCDNVLQLLANTVDNMDGVSGAFNMG
jgi:hypothetical protein